MRSGKRSEQPALDQIQLSLLRHVQLFGMTTRIAWHLDPDLRSIDGSAISKSIRQLTKAKILKAHTLHHGRFYFTYSANASSKIDIGARGTGPMNEPAKIASFCRLLIGLKYMPGYFPKPPQAIFSERVAGLPNAYFHHEAFNRTMLVRIDHNPSTSPGRIANKLRDDLLRMAATPQLKSRVRESRLGVAFATCTTARARQILIHFQQFGRVGQFPVQSLVVEELLPLFIPQFIRGVPIKCFVSPTQV